MVRRVLDGYGLERYNKLHPFFFIIILRPPTVGGAHYWDRSFALKLIEVLEQATVGWPDEDSEGGRFQRRWLWMGW